MKRARVAAVVLTLANAARAEETPEHAASQETRAPRSDGRAAVLFPAAPPRGEWRIAVGALVDILPTRVVESEVRQIPQITANGRIGLPAHFAADARLRTNVVVNEAELGLAFSGTIGPIVLAVGDHLGAWYGFLGSEGFDAIGFGWLMLPGVSIGYAWGASRFTLAAEAILSLQQSTKLGNSPAIARNRTVLAGASLLFTVETALSNGGIVYYGLGVIRAVPDYQAWIAFSDDRATLPYPRLVAGYEF